LFTEHYAVKFENNKPVMKKITVLIFVLIGFCNLASSQTKHTFVIEDGNFIYDGKPMQIHSGEMHFERVPKPYWKQRLQMMKAMGLNTVATYVFWNYHETAPGVWDFKTGNKNIAHFIKTAQEVGLFVILRPGPYACAEWEFGGFPWWLQKNDSLELRTYNRPFLDSCKTYINYLATQVRDLQITHGGPIIMVQVENEFGSYVAQRKDIPLEVDKKYTAAIKKELIDAGFNVPLFTSDGSWLFEGGTVAGALPAANGEDNIDNLKKIVNQYHNDEGPYMVAEFYPGWLDHWAEAFQKVAVKNVVDQTEKYLKAGVSFNFYMVHGGTNFGFTSGANYDKDHNIQPDITSYDYDAPISEAGWATPKYMALRQLFQQYLPGKLPPVPSPAAVIAIPNIKLNKITSLFSLKEKMKPVESNSPQTFEDLNQGYGYVLYSRQFKNAVKGKLEIKGLRDYAIVYVNQKKACGLNRYYNNYSCQIDIPQNATLDIFVENMGRINYGAEIIHNLKGIISPAKIDDKEVSGDWKMYQFPMDQQPLLKDNGNAYTKGVPVIYNASFSLTKTGDTFLDMRKFGKGIVFVNGHNIGRYWNVGPQQTLYLPGCWLKKGKNTITVFEELNNEQEQELRGIKTPILDELKK